jgi:hypothetical protein
MQNDVILEEKQIEENDYLKRAKEIEDMLDDKKRQIRVILNGLNVSQAKDILSNLQVLIDLNSIVSYNL